MSFFSFFGSFDVFNSKNVQDEKLNYNIYSHYITTFTCLLWQNIEY